MKRRRWMGWLALALAGGVAIGCNRPSVNSPYPADPLLAHKKPVEAKADQAKPVAVAQEPARPVVPAAAIAAMPRRPEGAAADTLVQRPALPGPGGPPVTAALAVNTRTTAEVNASPVGRRIVSGVYGHTPDYTWLQGTLEKHYRGHLELRYCDATEEDDLGGKVCLEDDPRLGRFKEGDVVAVEGELVRENGQLSLGASHHYPHYRIRSVEPVQNGQ
jgi:hypothetical protein